MHELLDRRSAERPRWRPLIDPLPAPIPHGTTRTSGDAHSYAWRQGRRLTALRLSARNGAPGKVQHVDWAPPPSSLLGDRSREQYAR